MTSDLNGTDWFLYALISTIIYGVFEFTYKLAARGGYSSIQIVNKAAITVTVLSGILILHNQSHFTPLPWILLYGFLNATCFASGTIAQISALRYMPTSHVFPIAKMSSIICIFLGFAFLGDRPTVWQWAGILMALGVILLVGYDMKSGGGTEQATDPARGLKLAIGAAFGVAFSMFVGKLASMHVPALNYIFSSYGFSAIYTYLIERRFGNAKRRLDARGLGFGVFIGTMNFAGYYLLLRAFSLGPLALVQGIFSTTMVITIPLSVLILKERFSLIKALCVVLALGALILIRL
ncbi:MAG TPA: DMT family transporter [Candidatus Ozemobacteraceae bacterium]|nr:DMT family transporter [Candidatus Ozemobacteraceae bacterium]